MGRGVRSRQAGDRVVSSPGDIGEWIMVVGRSDREEPKWVSCNLRKRSG